MPNRCLAIAMLALLPAILWAPWSNAAMAVPPASRPAMQDLTVDALNEIDQTPGSPTSMAGHSRSDEPPTGHLQDRSHHSIAYWSDLIGFAWPSMAAGASIGVAGGVIGVVVLLRREALIVLALPQVVAVGAAIGLRYNWPTFPPALVTVTAALAYLVKSQGPLPSRWSSFAIPSLYVGGLSISFLLIAGAGAHVEELQALFTGVDVAVTPGQALLVTPALLLVSLCVAILWRRWLLLAQAPAAAELAGVRPGFINTLFLVLLCLLVLIGTNVQGVVMVLAMLLLPATVALQWARRLPSAMTASAMLALLFLAIGFIVSNEYDWPLSRSVGGIGFLFVLLSPVIRWVIRVFVAVKHRSKLVSSRH